MVWYSHLLQNIPQFIVIHTVKAFGIVNLLAQGFLNRPGHRNHLWALLLKYRFPGLSPGNYVSKDLVPGQEIHPFN